MFNISQFFLTFVFQFIFNDLHPQDACNNAWKPQCKESIAV